MTLESLTEGGLRSVKGVLLCSESKQCSLCGSKLKMGRKNLEWIYDLKKTRISRPTTVYACESCNVDHVIRGTHVDDSGWESMRLPLRDLKKNPPRKNLNSGVRTYREPTLTVSKASTQARPYGTNATRDRLLSPVHNQEAAVGKQRKKSKRSCELCEFWQPNRKFCGLVYRTTAPDHLCKRFKRNFVKIYPGGGVSPR